MTWNPKPSEDYLKTVLLVYLKLWCAVCNFRPFLCFEIEPPNDSSSTHVIIDFSWKWTSWSEVTLGSEVRSQRPRQAIFCWTTLKCPILLQTIIDLQMCKKTMTLTSIIGCKKISAEISLQKYQTICGQFRRSFFVQSTNELFSE